MKTKVPTPIHQQAKSLAALKSQTVETWLAETIASAVTASALPVTKKSKKKGN